MIALYLTISGHNFSSLGRFEVLQTLSFGRGFVLGVELFSLPGLPGEPLLACGGDDARVNLFVRQEGKVCIKILNFTYFTSVNVLTCQFVRVMSLLGHEDWIRDLHCIQEGKLVFER